MIQSAIPPAVHVIVAIIPIVGITFGAVIVFFYLLWRHHEIKLQIKTGSFVQKNFNFEAFSLLAGLILTGVGSILTAVFGILNGFSYAILGGLIPASIGLCLLAFYKIYPSFHKESKDR